MTLDDVPALEAATISAGVNAIYLQGYAAAGDGGGGLWSRTTNSASDPGVVASADGAHWVPVPQPAGNAGRQFGVVGDGVADPTGSSYTFLGTDDTAALQAAIDFNAYFFGTKTLLWSTSVVSKPIMIGYGGPTNLALCTAALEGNAPAAATSGGFAGAGVACDFDDQPLVNFQGVRDGKLTCMALQGPFAETVMGLGLAGPSPTVDDTNGANWIADNRYAPACGVCVDGYAGPAPTSPYPTYSYAGWTGLSAQYNKAVSSRVTLEDVLINGFPAAVVVQPSGSDGNGDYVKWHRGWANYCKWGVSIAQTQSRNVDMDDLQFAFVYCCVANNVHGKQEGQLNMVSRSGSCGGVIKIFQLNGGSGPVAFEAWYAEGLYKLGEIGSGGSVSQTLSFRDSALGFNLQTTARGVPASVVNMLGSPGVSVGETQFTWSAGQLVYFYSVLPILAGAVLLQNNAAIISYMDDGGMATAPTYWALGHNALGGGLVVSNLDPRYQPHHFNFPVRDVDVGTVFGNAVVQDAYRSGARNFCVPIYARSVVPPSSSDPNEIVANPQTQRVTGYLMQSGATFNQATGVMSLTINSVSTDSLNFFAGANGDVIFDPLTGTVAYISDTSITSGTVTITAQAQNNLYTGSSSCSEVVAWSSSSARSIFVLNSRFYTPVLPVVATSTSGSSTLTNVTFLTAGSANQLVQAGDYIWFDDQNAEGNPFGLTVSTAKITTVGATTLTLAGNATVSATARIGLFIRQPPANF